MKKHYRIFLHFLLFFLATGMLPAQGDQLSGERKVALSGRVQDATSEAPLEFVAISVYRLSDSTLVDGGLTDMEGGFYFTLDPAWYYLTFNFIGYEQRVIPGIDLTDRKELSLGVIALNEMTEVLDEVEVTAERTQMELRLDKRVYNIGKDVSNMGGNASDILDNLPSVAVDIEGNVSLRGSQQVRILIDGKPSGLLGGGTDALRQLTGDMIERVEIITNPSARYDAEGEAGIINIVLKKEKQKGFNGTFGLVAGWPENFGANYGLNYRRNDLNFFSNFGLTYRDAPGQGYTFQRSEQEGTTYLFESTRKHFRGGISGNLQLGADWYLSSRDILTASVLFQSSNGQNDQFYTFRDFATSGETLQISERVTDEREDSYDLETALSYRKTFADDRQQFSMDFKYIINDDTEIAEYTQTSDTTSFVLNQRSSNTEDEENYFFQADYSHPVWEEGVLEMGTRMSRRRIDNDFTVEEEQADGTYDILPQLDNYMIYTENIYAAYLILGNEWGPVSYQLGLRSEYSDITTELVQTNEINPRDYINFFPSAHFTYELNEANSFQWSYSRRISRPRFRHLLPFYSFGDNRNLYAGNPDLEPEFAHVLEAGYLHYYDRGSLLASMYYRYRTDVIDRITIPNDEGGSIRIPVNLASQQVYGVEFNVAMDFFPWWRNNWNLNFYRAVTAGTYGDQDLSADNYTWSGRWNARFELPGKFDLQTAFDFRAPEVTTQGRQLAMYMLDAGVTRDVFNGNGTLIFSVRDIFNTRKWRGITDVEGFYRESEFQWRSRQFLLTFNYRLNQKKKDTDLFRGEGGGGGM